MTMLERIEFQKIKTGIKGLDTLFFGGLQLNNGPSNPGLVIAIKGARGLHKTMLAICCFPESIIRLKNLRTV